MRLSKEERAIERSLLQGEYRDVDKSEFEAIAHAVARRRKEAVLNIRVNRQDLENLKKKAKQFRVPYQSFISEILHRFAA